MTPPEPSLLGRVAGAVTGRVVDAVPAEAILDHVDVDALLDRVDLNHLLDRVDVDHLLDRVDVNRLLDRIDVDRLLARADVNALLSDVELEQLVRRAGIADIVADTTGHLAGRTLDVARSQVVGVDTVLAEVVERIRPGDPTGPAGPPALVERTTSATGRYAGVLSRALAAAVDVAVVVGTWSAATWLGRYLLDVLAGVEVGHVPEVVATGLLLAWGLVYITGATAIAGRTIGKGLVGLTVVTRSGSPVRPGASLLRTLLLPVSTSFFGLGALLILLRRDRRGLHDLLSGTCVVYDWGDRPAELPGPLAAYLRARGA